MSTSSTKVVKPYTEVESKKVQVERMFDNIAPHYDLLNRVLSLGIDTIWRKKAIQKLSKLDIKHLLDVATGTGDFALEAKKQLDIAKITGIDISSNMISIGNKKIQKKGLSDQMSLEIGDSEAIQYSDLSFDAATVAFGVRNFQNLSKGIGEIYRVLRPSGMIVVLEFSRPKVFPFKQLFNLYFKYILPLIGRFTSKDQRAYSYLYESVQAFPEGDAFLQVLQENGFVHTKCERLSLGICSIYTAIKP